MKVGHFAVNIIGNIDRNHFHFIKEFSLISDELVIFSPFCFYDFGDFFQEILHAKIKKVSLITTIKPDEARQKTNSLVSFVDELNSRGVAWNISVNNRLHGKLYFFINKSIPQKAILTSANLTESGLIKNHEWGYVLSNPQEINFLFQETMKTIEVHSLTENQLINLMVAVEDLHISSPAPEPFDSKRISDIIFKTTGITWEFETRLFLKPIGSIDDKIFEGDYSLEDEMYFSKRRPSSVRINDLLICYAVGSTKLISVFKVQSDPINTNKPDDRWPWYVKAVNLSPNYGKIWFSTENSLGFLSSVFLKANPEDCLTYNEGKTLGALNFGADKIRLSENFARYLIKRIEEKNA